MSKKAIVAYSGGLDTTYCTVYLKNKGYEVHTVFADTGGFSEEELTVIENNAYKAGSKNHETLQIKDKFYDECLKYLIFGNVLRGSNYPLCVSSERVFQARAVAQYAEKTGAQSVAHGSTGAGNDQVRFDLAFRVYAPELEIIAPVREQALSREEEVAYLKENGIEWPENKKSYSINQGLWGMTIGGSETLTPDQALPEEAWPYPVTRSEPKTITIGFKQGEPVSLDGELCSPSDLIQSLNDLGYDYGIGRGMHLGDTILGIKGRVAFAAPAATLLIDAHRLLEKHTLSQSQRFHKNYLGEWYGMTLHKGLFMEPAMRDVEALMKNSQSKVSGTVKIKLHPYRFELVGVKSPNDIMNREGSDYGEKMGQWSAQDAVGFIKLMSI